MSAGVPLCGGIRMCRNSNVVNAVEDSSFCKFERGFQEAYVQHVIRCCKLMANLRFADARNCLWGERAEYEEAITETGGIGILHDDQGSYPRHISHLVTTITMTIQHPISISWTPRFKGHASPHTSMPVPRRCKRDKSDASCRGAGILVHTVQLWSV